MKRPYPKYHPPIDLPYAVKPRGRTWDVLPSPHQRLGKKERRLWGATVSNVPYAYEDPYLTSVQDIQYTVDTSQMHRYPYIRDGEDPGRMPMLFEEPFPAATTGSANYLDGFGSDEFFFGGAPTNREEGDAFRNWVNDNYPDYAASIDLGRSGKHDNSYVARAWAKHGAEYEGGGEKGFDLDKTMAQAKGLVEKGGKVAGFFKNLGGGKGKSRRSKRKSKRSSRKSDASKLGISPRKLMRIMKKARKGDPEAKAILASIKGRRSSGKKSYKPSGKVVQSLSSGLSKLNSEFSMIKNSPEPQPFSNLFAQIAENEKVNVVQRMQAGQSVPLMIKQVQPLQQELTARSKDLQNSGEKLEKEKKKNNVLLYSSIAGGVTTLGLLSYFIFKK